MIETGINGVQLFKIDTPIQCAPAVYEPSITAIVSGSKEAIWNGNKHEYDSNKYICCTMSTPIEAGAPSASSDNPLVGVYISVNTRLMTDIVIEVEKANSVGKKTNSQTISQGIFASPWNDSFTDALLRLLQLTNNSTDATVLGQARIRELYYTVLKSEAGIAFKHAFGLGNDIARTIEYLSSKLSEPVSIDELASFVGMSRAVFHRKFKQTTNMSPIQFIKSMRLNNAAKRIADGTNVSIAAQEVGYLSSSQFSREFKRMYGTSPKKWRQSQAFDSAL